MSKIRIGKDISLRWTITINEQVESLVGKDITITLTRPTLKKVDITEYTITDTNKLVFSLNQNILEVCGDYLLTCYINKGKANAGILDKKAFTIVPRSWMEEDDDTEVEDVDLDGDITTGGITYEAGDGIDITDYKISVDDTVAKKTELNKRIVVPITITTVGTDTMIGTVEKSAAVIKALLESGKDVVLKLALDDFTIYSDDLFTLNILGTPAIWFRFGVIPNTGHKSLSGTINNKSVRLSYEKYEGDINDLTTTNKEDLVSAINEVNANKADKATTLGGYGITNAYTKTEVNTELSKKQDKFIEICETSTTCKYRGSELVQLALANTLTWANAILVLKNYNSTLKVATFICGEQHIQVDNNKKAYFIDYIDNHLNNVLHYTADTENYIQTINTEPEYEVKISGELDGYIGCLSLGGDEGEGGSAVVLSSNGSIELDAVGDIRLNTEYNLRLNGNIIATEEYVDNKIGDIDTILNNIIGD